MAAKKINILIVCFLVIAIGCDNYQDIDESAQLKQELLIGEWKLDFASKDEIDITEEINDYQTIKYLMLNFNNDGSWSSENAESIFETVGNWSFNQDTPDFIQMNNDIVSFAFSFDGNILNLIFDLSGNPIGGSGSGLTGRFMMSLSKITETN